MSKVVFLGDSFLAGSQNGALIDTHQAHSIPALLSQQAGFSLTQPLIAAPGVPAELRLVERGFPPVFAQTSGTSTGREDAGALITNLAVPGQTVDDLLHKGPSAQAATFVDKLTNLVLDSSAGTGGSQLDRAIALQPSTVFLWIGANDALPALASGNPSTMTPLSDFTADFSQIMAALKGKTSARLIVANLPDLTLLPYLTPAPLFAQQVAGVTGRSATDLQAELGLGSDDLVNQAGIAILSGELDLIRAGATPPALPGDAVLTAAEILRVQSAIQSYNQVVAQQVAAAGGTLVDLHSYFNALKAGVTINGTDATLDFLGGIFSVDALHPGDTGYALLANQFIASANTALGVFIPSVNVSAIAASDPVFGSNITVPFSMPQLLHGSMLTP